MLVSQIECMGMRSRLELPISIVVSYTVYPGFFFSRGTAKIGKCEAFFFCVNHFFLQFLKFLTEKYTGYNFYVFNILRFERHSK